MKKKVIVRAPFLTQSGYGEHARFVIRALRSREDLFDIYLEPLNWGQTGWISKINEENDWFNRKIEKTALYVRNNPQFDMSIQVTIPNEWQRLAPVNIGVTAGIETTRVSPAWLEKANIMDKIIVVSEHAKFGFLESSYIKTHKETGQQQDLRINVPIEVIGYPVRKHKKTKIKLDFKHDFNFLVVAQWSPRKNIENTIRWWVEENLDQEVGLVLKTSLRNGSLNDRERTEERIKALLQQYEDRVCSVSLIHGTMEPEEVSALYNHPKIKALIGMSHGEGFGLPLYEAAYNSLPVIAPGWSGQCDFLYKTFPGGKTKALFAEVSYDMAPVQPEAHWEDIIVPESSWCFPHQGSYKMRLRQVRKDYSKWKKKAVELSKYLNMKFSEEEQNRKFVSSIYPESQQNATSEVSEMFDDLMSEAT